MNLPSDQYIAAFLDAEGCIYIAVKGLGAGMHSGRVVFSNTDRQVLEDIHKALDDRGTLQQINKASDRRSDMWQLICSEADSAVVLKRLLPYLRLKKREAETLLDFFDHKRLYKMGRGRHKQDRETRRRIWKSREFYKRSLQMLKSRFHCANHNRNLGWEGKPLDEAFDASYHGWHASDAEPRLLPT